MPSEKELKRQREEAFPYMPLISIVVPTYETPERYLRELLDSVIAQTYQNFQLCLADGSATDAVERIVAEYMRGGSKIRYQRLTENGGISENTNCGFKMAEGEFFALMDHDDVLSKNALYEMVRCLNTAYSKEERNMALIYSDEDKMNQDSSVYSRPHFKPDFNLEFLRRNNYFCHFLLFSAELLKRAGALKKEFDGAQDYDFTLRCVDAGAIVSHVPKILYHWRIHEGSTAGNSVDKAYAFDNGCRAIEEHLKRSGEEGRAEVTENLGVYRVEYTLSGVYRIAVFAEEEGQIASLKRHYQTVNQDKKTFRLEIAYYKTDSGIEKECMGDYIVYIRKGIRVNPNGLLEMLLRHCQHSHTAAAGAKILKRRKRVSSCGLAYGADGRLVSLNGGIPAEYRGYFLHAVIPKNVSALSFGCVMLQKKAFLQAGGFDQSLKGRYKDADLCFKLTELGYRIVTEPELAGMGFGKEEEPGDPPPLFLSRWEEKLQMPDPCYNSNLSLQDGRTYAMKE